MEKESTDAPQFISERRRHQRFLVHLPIEYRRFNESKLRPGHTVNFSEEGLTVSLSEPIEIGEKLEIRVYFSCGSDVGAIAADVRVVWADTRVMEDAYYRFGVSYVVISPEDMGKLEAFLDQYANPEAHQEFKPSPGNLLNPHKPFLSAPSGPHASVNPLPILDRLKKL